MDYFQLKNLFYFLFSYESKPFQVYRLSSPTWVGGNLSSWSPICFTVAERLPQTQQTILFRSGERGPAQTYKYSTISLLVLLH